jgi:hypothetical protein
MARSGLDKSGKYLLLAEHLHVVSSGMGEIMARGVLETLWSAAYERADDYFSSEIDIELSSKWRGERGYLTRALVECRLVTPADGRTGYVIHDFWVHCPPWVKEKAARNAARQVAGHTISEQRRLAGIAGQAAQRAAKRQVQEHLPATASEPASVCPAKTSPGTGRDGQGRALKDLAAKKQPPKQPAPFYATRAQVLNAIATSSGGRFLPTPPIKGGIFKLDRFRHRPDCLEIADRIGTWMANGGDAFKGRLDGRHLGSDIEAWIAQSESAETIAVVHPKVILPDDHGERLRNSTDPMTRAMFDLEPPK